MDGGVKLIFLGPRPPKALYDEGKGNFFSCKNKLFLGPLPSNFDYECQGKCLLPHLRTLPPPLLLPLLFMLQELSTVSMLDVKLSK